MCAKEGDGKKLSQQRTYYSYMSKHIHMKNINILNSTCSTLLFEGMGQLIDSFCSSRKDNLIILDL